MLVAFVAALMLLISGWVSLYNYLHDAEDSPDKYIVGAVFLTLGIVYLIVCATERL